MLDLPTRIGESYTDPVMGLDWMLVSVSKGSGSPTVATFRTALTINGQPSVVTHQLKLDRD